MGTEKPRKNEGTSVERKVFTGKHEIVPTPKELDHPLAFSDSPNPTAGELIKSTRTELKQIEEQGRLFEDPPMPKVVQIARKELDITDQPTDIESSATWKASFKRYLGRRKEQQFESTFKESLLSKDANLQRHLFLSDLQIPDHNVKAIKAVKKFIKDFSPDTLHLVGDLMNFTAAGTYSVEGGYKTSLGDEIRMTRTIVDDLVKATRTANPEAKVIWYEGNHEYRLQRYLARNAEALTDITDEYGERVMTVPHLFGLKDKNIDWVPYYDSHMEDANTEVEHGDIARSKAGYTAHGMLDKRGRSGFSGHTHRLALVSKNQGGDTKYWVETGSLCNPEPTPRWMKKPDWTNGFAVGIYDKQENIMHPMPILMQKNQFMFGGRVYKP